MNITYAYVETTTYCNLSCKFCNRNKKAHHMTLDEFDLVLQQLTNHQLTEAKLMGMGEPFMHPHFDLICKKFKTAFPQCSVISSTNCQIKFNSRFQNALNFIDTCYLSVDGYKSTYEQLRQGASWNKLLHFLECISNYKVANNLQISLPINFTISPANVYDIEYIIAIASQFGLDGVRLNIVQNWSESEHITLLPQFTSNQLSYISQFASMLKGKSPWTFSDCFWVNSGCMISATGDVRVCCMNTTTLPIGNIFKTSLLDILNSELFQAIKTGCQQDNPTTHCRTCSYKELSPILGQLRGV